MFQSYLKLKLNVLQTKIIISFTPQDLVLFQGFPSELIHHPSSSTTQKRIMFDIIFLLSHIQYVTKSCPFYLPSVSQNIYSLLSPPPLPPQPTISQMETALASEHSLFLYIHSGPFQSVLHTLARVIISEYKTNLVTVISCLKILRFLPVALGIGMKLLRTVYNALHDLVSTYITSFNSHHTPSH